MNTRCYKCGWNFALSREVVEGAVAAAPDEKFYVSYCPRCRQANKIPMQQLKRTLPVGWTPPAPVAAAAEAPVAVAVPEPAPVREPEAVPAAKTGRKRGSKPAEAAPTPEPMAVAVAEPVVAAAAEAEPAPAAKAPRKRASKTTEAAPTPEATPAAKKASRSKAKPS